MAINFDQLPKERPEGNNAYALTAPGLHKASIESAEIKTSKAGNPYLNVKYKVDDNTTMFDMIMDSDTPAIQYKLSRFVQALKLPLVGSLELEDLRRIIVGKELVIDVIHKPNKYTNASGEPVETIKAEVDLFGRDIFYPIEQYAELVAANKADEEDSTFTPEQETKY